MNHILYSSNIKTPLGTLQAVASNQHLIILQFTENDSLIKKLHMFKKTNHIIEQKNNIIEHLEQQLLAYFQGNLTIFTVPTKLHGTDFQKKCWHALQHIPYGSITSYKKQAEYIQNPKAFRAVANANKNNPISIIYPCHRIIKSNGDLCGYNGSINKKQALLNLEATFKKK